MTSSVQYTKLNDLDHESEVVIYSNDKRSGSQAADENGSDHLESDEYEKTFKSRPNVRKDLPNIVFLMFLYMLQGVPLGLTGSLPFILGSRKVSYADQGTFSLAFWPFCLKLLWAPLVDSLYIKRFGRRKSWLVPMQYIMGFYMIIFSTYVHQILESNGTTTSTKQDIYTLTVIFFVLTFFAATQDVAVDGWGLTILSKENVAWSSTCNNTGQTAGWFIGNVVFLVFESADFSNKYFRPIFGLANQPYGLITIDKFMQFFGALFLITTTFVLVFKREKETTSSESSIEDSLTLTQTYKLVWKIFNLKSVRQLSFILLTMKMAFAVQAMTYLKLIEQGVPKESLGLLAIPLTPLEIVLPLLISRFTNGPRPMTTLLKTYPFRLMVIWCFLTPYFRDPVSREYPFYYFLICIVISGLNSCMVTTHSVSQVAFFTQISDKRVGGSMMTLLNTIANIGSGWPNTLILYLVDFISIKHCQHSSFVAVSSTTDYQANETDDKNLTTILTKISQNYCKNELESKACTSLGGSCVYTLDAFYLISIVAALFGLVWLVSFTKLIRRLESQSKSAWKISFTF